MLDGMETTNATWTSLLMSRASRHTRIAPSAPVVEVFERGDRTVVRVYGEIDFDVAPGFDEALHTAVGRSISGLDLELGAMTFCDDSRPESAAAGAAGGSGGGQDRAPLLRQCPFRAAAARHPHPRPVRR